MSAPSPAQFRRTSRTWPSTGRPFFGALGYIFNDLAAAYPDLQTASEFALNDRGSALLYETARECVADTKAKHAFGTNQSLTSTGKPFGDVLREPRYADAVNAQRFGTVAPRAPIFVVQSITDDTVSHDQTPEIAVDWCNRRATVTLMQRDMPPIAPVADHALPGVFSIPESVDWLATRFAHAPVESNCGSSLR